MSASPIIAENILKVMAPEDRRRLGRRGLLTAEAVAKGNRRRELVEQRIFVGLLKQKEDAGVLCYDWSATNRRVTCRVGMPDFKIYREGRVLLGEMKMPGGRLSPAQAEMHERLLRSGTPVEIWHSADEAWRQLLNWLWIGWRIWSPGKPENGDKEAVNPS